MFLFYHTVLLQMSAINAAVLNEQLEAKCHLMEVTFLVLLSLNHITHEAVESVCVFVYHLRARYFTDNLQVSLLNRCSLFTIDL